MDALRVRLGPLNIFKAEGNNCVFRVLFRDRHRPGVAVWSSPAADAAACLFVVRGGIFHVVEQVVHPCDGEQDPALSWMLLAGGSKAKRGHHRG